MSPLAAHLSVSVTRLEAPPGQRPHSSSLVPSAGPQIAFTERGKVFSASVRTPDKVPVYRILVSHNPSLGSPSEASSLCEDPVPQALTHISVKGMSANQKKKCWVYRGDRTAGTLSSWGRRSDQMPFKQQAHEQTAQPCALYFQVLLAFWEKVSITVMQHIKHSIKGFYGTAWKSWSDKA